MKDQFIEDLKEGDSVDSKFSVKYKKSLREYKNGYMFVIGLADKTDEIEAKFWGGDNKEKVKRLFESIDPGDVVKVKGTASVFQNRLQINVEEGDLERTDDYDIEDFVQKTEKDIDGMFEELEERYEDLDNVYLKELMQRFFDDEEFVKKFRESPAAMYYHHAHIGGLLEHTLDMIKMAETLHGAHPRLDRDLLLVGCFIHDVGKIEEFDVTTNIKQSRGGLLTGH
ncbi:MAG: OB-fold nucleic acid binding domain-containing protein, partial [Candidatus Aenigmatarchaeota archaeon]